MPAKTLGGKVISVTRSGNYQYGIVEGVNNGLATVRLSTGGTRLTNLSIIGATPQIGATVIVDYSSNTPYVRVALRNEVQPTTTLADPAPAVLPTASSTATGILSISSVPGSGSYTGITTTFTAGGTLSAGTPVYISSGGSAIASVANDISTSRCIAVAAQAITSGNSGTFLLLGFLNGGFGFTPGGYVYVSTSGGLTQTIPSGSLDCITIVGMAISSSVLYVNPQLVVVELV